jgi:hypothetical protein
MHAADVEEVLNTDLFIQKDVKTPRPEKITACVKHKPDQEENQIYIFDGSDHVYQLNLSKKQGEQNNGYEYC